MTVRQTAQKILLGYETLGQYPNIALDSAIERYGFSTKDRALLSTLVYGVIERKITLDYLINGLSELPPDKIEMPVRTALRMGLYQLAYLDRVPDHAAVNESVSLLHGRAERGFCNALLRGFARSGGKVKLPERGADEAYYLSVAYSVPKWLCARIQSLYGGDTEKYLAALVGKRPAQLRVNTLKTDRESLVRRLADAGLKCENCRYSKVGVSVIEGSLSRELAADSDCFVQDEASQLCVSSLAPIPGDTVIDACACPGGKSFSAAMDMSNRGRIVSCDLHKNKLSLIERGASRLGIRIIETKEADAREYSPEFDEKADRVLCDVPCSGFGVISKKPDVRYKLEEDIEKLPEIQYAILENCSRYVKCGGSLVYSTCTILPEENERIIDRFLREHDEFVPCDFEFGDIKAVSGMYTFSPLKNGTDGFFIAKLIREVE